VLIISKIKLRVNGILVLMITAHSLSKTTWVDVVAPTKEEVMGLIERFHLDARIGEDLLSPTPQTVVARYESAVHLVIHFPALRHSTSGSMRQEIDIVITQQTVITCRYDTVDAIESLARQAEVAEINKSIVFNHGTELAGWILQSLYRAFRNEIVALEDQLSSLEQPMFQGNEQYVVKELSRLSRNMIMCKKILSSHTYVLEDLIHHSERVFGFAGAKEFRVVLKYHQKLLSRLETVNELLLGVRDTNNSLLSLRQQSTMQLLTFITVVVGALLVVFDIVTLGQLSGDFVPWIQHDKLMVLGVYILFTGIITLWARARRWI
jgi:Mg2+ and Co2+ transporter CorA